MEYHKYLPERPFRAIKNGIKKVEGRVPDTEDNEYKQMKTGDSLILEIQDTGELLRTKILYVHHYSNFHSMLKKEGAENVLSSRGNIDQGIESFNSFPKYRENVVKFGIYAIGIKPINNKKKF